jgi:lactoylglutathione lyase
MANGMHLSGFGNNVDDLDRSVEFYTNALGLEEKTKIDLGELHEVLVAGSDDRTSILLVKHAERTDVPVPGTGFEKIVLVTDDVEAVYERATTNGGEAVKAPWHLERMGITVALVRDPDGYLLELIQQPSSST